MTNLEWVLNEAEKVILSNLDKKFEWISRDKDGNGWVYESKPYKFVANWNSSSGDLEDFLNLFPDLFKFIKWEDEEPYNIKELLEANGVKKMNKYQEAYDYIVDATNGADGIIMQMLVLQELVERATPKKTKNRTTWNARCPSCDELFVFCEDRKRPYCQYCGQALDWSENDE